MATLNKTVTPALVKRSSPIPTESRIFATRFARALKQQERLHANGMSPGAKTWDEAVNRLYDRMVAADSPVKGAAILRKTIAYLDAVSPADMAHIKIIAHGNKRSAILAFMTLVAGGHPFRGVDEEGVVMTQICTSYSRHGRVELLNRVEVAYVSQHALGRLHERDIDLTNQGALGVLGFIAVLGHLTRDSNKHVLGELCLHFGDTLVVGSLKHGRKHMNGRQVNGTFYDVRTVLSAEDVVNRDMLEQGKTASQAVARWLVNERSVDLDRELAESIPFLPRRTDDYALRTVRH